jgi:putative phage-type endonuclease
MTEAVATPTTEQRKATWLAERRTCISGTELSCILGLNRYAGPMQVYLDKKGLAEPLIETSPMRWGKRLEREILKGYADDLQRPIQFADSYQLIRCPGFPLLGATLDARWLDGDCRPVDAKNRRQKTPDWGESGTDQFPRHYQIQLIAQMMVTGTQVADLAALFGGNELVPYTIILDPDYPEIIKEKVSKWWEFHIVQDNPPEVDGSDASTEYLKAKFARGVEMTKPATDQVRAWVEARKAADAEIKEAERRKTEAENRLKDYLGEATAISGLITWRNNKDSAKTDWEKLALTYHPTKGMIEQFTTTKPGPRVLRFS